MREEFGLRDDDAIWIMVMALDHFDGLFRAYPKELETAAARTLERARAAYAAAAQDAASHAEQALASKVAETSVVLAKRLADRPLAVNRWCVSFAMVVLFGALCMQAGAALSGPETPFWMHTSRAGPLDWRAAVVAALSVPAGWMALALCLPLGGHAAWYGWRLASDESLPRSERAVGWCIIASFLAVMVTCVVGLVRIG